MRPVLLIILSNLIAFALGVVVTLWISLSPAIQRATPASEAVARKGGPSSAPTGPPSLIAGPQAAAAQDAPPPAAPPQAQASPPAIPPSSSPSAGAGTKVPAKPSASGTYVLRFGAFADATDAARMQAALKKYGYAPDLIPAGSGGTAEQAVQLGAFPDRNAAAEAAASLQRDTGISALVMKSAPP